MSEPTNEQINALIEAMDQLLDDMGIDGRSVCLFAKAQARVAFEPFLDRECVEYVMPLEEALKVLAETI